MTGIDKILSIKRVNQHPFQDLFDLSILILTHLKGKVSGVHQVFLRELICLYSIKTLEIDL